MLAIGFGDLAQRARRAFKLTGRLPLNLDETVLPVAIVANLDRAPFQSEPRTWMFGQGSTGDATHSPYIQVQNPAGSNILVTIDALCLLVDVANIIQIRLARNAQGLPVGVGQQALTNAPQPATLNTTGVSTTQFNTTSQVGPSGSIVATFKLPANTEFAVPFPSSIVLFPGDVFALSGALAAYTITPVIFGSEYVQTAP